MMFFQGITDIVFGVGAEIDTVTTFCAGFSVAGARAIDRDDESMVSLKITKCAVRIFVYPVGGLGVAYAEAF